MEQRDPQEILAVPVGNSPGWPIPVLSISLSVHLPIIPSTDGAKTRVEIYVSPSGPGRFTYSRETSHSAPQLSISAYFPHRTAVIKKTKKEKKKRKATTMSGSQIQQAKYTASIGGKGLLPHWPVGNHSLLFTLFTNLVHCTIRMRHPSPETTMSTPASHPPQPGVGRGQVRKGRKRQRLMRMSVGETEAEASREN